MNVLDLFSGIGGFSLGLERAGMRTVAFCEITPYCRAVLRKHWPHVRIYNDVRELTAARLGADAVPTPDLICGGFPCQDISLAGGGAGLRGERSGLWRDFARLISEIRPRYAVVENVAALRSRGLGDVLGDLAALGYDAEWHCLPASHFGASHRRDRIWIIAYAESARRENDEGRPRSAAPHWRQILTSDDVGSRPRQRIPEPTLVRVVHGISADVDAVAALGNAVVPQIPEIIGRAILAWEQSQ